MESTMHTETLGRVRRFVPERQALAGWLAALRGAMRRSRIPEAAHLSPHLRRDVGLPPEVHRPTHAPPRVF
jgi:hypothetical protein